MAQDFYELLGVARDADAATVKRAYRRRARELHPDVSDAPDAEERFRRVTLAYEVLSDDARRQMYDRYGEAGLRQGGFEPRFADMGSIADIFSAFFGDDMFGGGSRADASRSAGRGQDVQLGVDLSFREGMLGSERELQFDALGACETCDGRGAASEAGVQRCDTCAGQGAVRTVARSLLGQIVQERVCPTCAGRGETVVDPCDTCHGTGEQMEERTVTVAVPGGIQDGQRIRLTGRGGAGLRGAPAGNLYVDVRVADDERFLRDGDDLITVVDVPAWDAALGTTCEVATVDGDPRDIEVPAGTQPGTVFTLRGLGAARLRTAGRGAAERGDLRVACNVLVPTRVGDEQRALLERLRELDDARSYGGSDDGIVGKLRRMLRT